MNQEPHITSIKDEKVVEARALHSQKGRLSEKKILLEGKEQIQWAMNSPCRLKHVFVHDKEKNSAFANELRSKNIPLNICSDGIIKKISDTTHLVPFVGVADWVDPKESGNEDFTVVLDGLHDFGNIGTIVRTANGFGIGKFVSTDENLDFFYKKTIDSSRGTVFSSQLRRYGSGAEAVNALKKQGYQIVVTTPHASTIQAFAKIEQKPMALVFGNETNGVSDEVMALADVKIQIPMSGPVESFNVAVAAGISLYEIKIKWVLAMLTKKIQESIGRDLYCASRWLRLVFNAKLQEVCPLNADQAIMMMILKCDGKSTREALPRDAGISPECDAAPQIQFLIDQGFISERNHELVLLEKGEEAIAKIWNVHELAEHLAFEGVPQNEKATFLKVLDKVLHNCAKITPF